MGIPPTIPQPSRSREGHWRPTRADHLNEGKPGRPTMVVPSRGGPRPRTPVPTSSRMDDLARPDLASTVPWRCRRHGGRCRVRRLRANDERADGIDDAERGTDADRRTRRRVPRRNDPDHGSRAAGRRGRGRAGRLDRRRRVGGGGHGRRIARRHGRGLGRSGAVAWLQRRTLPPDRRSAAPRRRRWRSRMPWPADGPASRRCSSWRMGLDELRSLDDEGQLRLRVNAYLAPYPPGIPDDERFGIWFTDYEPRQTFSPRLRIGGVKLFADSYAPAAPLHMLLTEAYADRPGYLGEAFWEPDAFRDLVRTLHDDGWQVATHTLRRCRARLRAGCLRGRPRRGGQRPAPTPDRARLRDP